MAGKIIADQIQSTTAGTLDTKYVVNGSAKAWSHSGLDDNVIEDSLNTSALSDEGTGLVNYSFVSSFNSANHVDVGMIGNNAAHVFYNGANAKAAGSTGTIRLYDTSNAHANANTINILSHGDLA
jgi:hypothetical protein